MPYMLHIGVYVLEAEMILGLGPAELLIIVVVVLVIFGPKNLPKLGSALGKTGKSVREGMEDIDSDSSSKKASSSAKSQEAEDVVVEDADSDKSEKSAASTSSKSEK